MTDAVKGEVEKKFGDLGINILKQVGPAAWHSFSPTL